MGEKAELAWPWLQLSGLVAVDWWFNTQNEGNDMPRLKRRSQPDSPPFLLARDVSHLVGLHASRKNMRILKSKESGENVTVLVRNNPQIRVRD